MSATINNWNISGSHPVVEALRAAAAVIPTAVTTTISSDASEDSDAVVIGPALLESSGRVVPFHAAFEAIEVVKREIEGGASGSIYGCFTSMRIERGASAAEVRWSALLPAIAVTLDTIPGVVGRVWAERTSLFSNSDAWFVTMRYADDTLLTIEAAAMANPGAGRELLVEVTAAERVLRAEPTRQAVIIEAFDAPTRRAPWWEDLAERYLQLVMVRDAERDRRLGQRIREVWKAVEASAETGKPVTL
jgi:hypothetical protein